MDFLDKLYESNYFGIGLFAVISFLVVTFLIVLFFGKRDEKRRRLEASKELENNNVEDSFKETSMPTSVEVPVTENTTVVPEAVPPIMNALEPDMVTPAIPSNPATSNISSDAVAPISFEEVPITPVAPINYSSTEFVELPKEETMNVPVTPVINEIQTPIVTEPIRNVEPIKLDTTTYDVPVEPKVIEPIRITIPEETKTEPVINEEIGQPVVPDSYYKPIENVQNEEIEVPNIDFDALAKSISDELDELENSSNTYHENVKVTPINEVVSKPNTQFSSVYVSEPVKSSVGESPSLPNKIDLPTMKSDDIEPENYNL